MTWLIKWNHEAWQNLGLEKHTSKTLHLFQLHPFLLLRCKKRLRFCLETWLFSIILTLSLSTIEINLVVEAISVGEHQGGRPHFILNVLWSLTIGLRPLLPPRETSCRKLWLWAALCHTFVEFHDLGDSSPNLHDLPEPPQLPRQASRCVTFRHLCLPRIRVRPQVRTSLTAFGTLNLLCDSELRQGDRGEIGCEF